MHWPHSLTNSMTGIQIIICFQKCWRLENLLVTHKKNWKSLNLPIQVYKKMNSFNGVIRNVLKYTKQEDINIIVGDFNSKVEGGLPSAVTAHWGLGERNERGKFLVIFCQEEDFVISNTLFQVPLRHMYTWISHRDKPGHIVRNQIDFILINKRFRNSFFSV